MKLVSILDSTHSTRVGICTAPHEILVQESGRTPWDAFSLIRFLHDHDGEIPEAFCAGVDMSTVQLAAPLTRMEKIICVGKNYLEHAVELGSQPPELPVIFGMFASAIIGPDQNIVLPRISHQVDYEAELVVVIGKEGFNIPCDAAMEHVFGYCCGNDVTARDWQKGRPGGQWLLGKTCDTFAPIGPWIVTRDEIENPHDLEIQLRLNGQTRQQSNTRHMIFSIAQLISHVSQFVTLKVGDLLFTGTPGGVGAGRTPPQFLQAGDVIEVEIGGIGCLRNTVTE
jgi:2-keto-4-pentenoate hydratase/2-oxohepta-3-ene-1,7-dioic acid hydratase in catechol pathway